MLSVLKPLLFYLQTAMAMLWEGVTSVSTFLKPYAEVVNPINELTGFLIATVVALYQFVSNRLLKLKLERVEKAVSAGEDEPWLLYNPHPYKEKRGLFHEVLPNERNTKYVCLYNQKGGVGKTTLAMNFAAYLDKKGYHVLLVDLDYQGSLSSAMLSACDIPSVESKINELFEKNLTGDEAIGLATSLAQTRSIVKKEIKLPHTQIITSYYPFGKLENKLHLKWLIDDKFKIDIRHILARGVCTAEARRKFDVVIFDCPPRLTTGTVNAICASTHLLVPTILDNLSTEAVGPTIQAAKKLMTKLNPDLQLLGAIGNLTRLEELNATEREALLILRQALEVDGWGDRHVFKRTIPRRAAVSNVAGEDIAYLNKKEDFYKLFDELGDELVAALRLTPPVQSDTGLSPNAQPSFDFVHEPLQPAE
jgi:cellulose biosynthesis protein BcsQ